MSIERTLSSTPRVLVVDDDPDLRAVLAEALTADGYAVAVARDGAEALERLRTEPLPGLIVLDLMMPGMNGREFRRRQQAEAAWARIPVVIVSAVGVPEYTLGLDPAAVFGKPFDLTALLRAVELSYRTPAASVPPR